ncbi:MAG: hypothetical protein WBF42_10975, partial [Terracidiphilus sp.]
LGLADEFLEPSRAQLQLKSLFLVGARGADQPVRCIISSADHDDESVAAGGAAGKTVQVLLRLENLPPNLAI